MVTKKNPKANLEKKRFAFFQIGLVLAAAITLAAFEYASPVFSNINIENTADDITPVFTPEQPEIFVVTKNVKPKIIMQIIDEVKAVKKPALTDKHAIASTDIDIDMSDFPDGAEPGNEGPFKGKNYGPIAGVDVQILPQFPGGQAAMAKWIAKNINIPDYVYPASGTIHVSFIVNKSGKITDVNLAKGIDRDHDKAAIAVVRKMPNWTPGEHFGKKVDVQYNLPIKVLSR